MDNHSLHMEFRKPVDYDADALIIIMKADKQYSIVASAHNS